MMMIAEFKQLPMLLKREFWEHRTMFLYLPAVVSAVSVGILVLGSVLIEDGTVKVLNMFDLHLSDLADYMLFTTLWFVMFFYLVVCLYQDRKDRSVLFWKSLPISDGMTVFSKLVAGLLMLPLIYVGFIILCNISALLVGTVISLGQGSSVLDNSPSVADVVLRWLDMFGYIFFSLVWCLPMTGWLLLVSSWAKSVPLVWVVGIPLLVVLVELIFLPGDLVRGFMGAHIPARYSPNDSMSASLFSFEGAIALVIGLGFVIGAVWRRRHADEI